MLRPRVSSAQATQLGRQIPAGTQVNRASRTITLTTDSVHLAVVASPAFTGSALWFLGDPTAAGMHTGTLTFTAATHATYHYLCPVPGHAQRGMTGIFTVSRTS